jgi:asparagine synthase (glutamine-hydrolysing)
MCGIAGAVGLRPAAAALAVVRRMTDAIIHRGPDDDGAFVDEGVAFGIRRLSIIDLAQGHQPIWTERGTGIVFNGEIYNYRALRADLEARGVRFRTQSDTEVIARLYDAEGIACLRRLDGMFAICLYDPAAGMLHLARDRLGKKPLYYGEIGDAFYFASEIKAILAVLPQRPGINRQAVQDFLTLRYVPGPDTIWNGIHKLEPATCLTLDLSSRRLTTTAFWSVEFRSEQLDRSRDYVGEFERMLLGAVQKRLVAADVPVGILLSGGLDSSAVAAAAVELGHQAFHTFSVAFADGGDSDETPFAREVAARLGAHHAEVVIDQRQFIDFLPDFVRFADEPLADLASIPLHYVCKLARRDVKVVLSGEGADEILAGYDMERVAARLDRWRWLARLPRPLLATLAGMAPESRRRVLGALARGGWSGVLAELGAHMTRVWSEVEKAELCRDGARFLPTERLVQEWYGETNSPYPLDRLQQVYCRSWLVEDLLMKADKMSMANSLELRCPFLDHALVEWSAALPREWKVGAAGIGYRSKRILRDFARTRLPASIIDRPKRGFPVPAYGWLEGKLGAWAEDRVFRPGGLDRWFDMAVLRPVLAAARGGAAAAQHKIWSLLILDFWLEAWA